MNKGSISYDTAARIFTNNRYFKKLIRHYAALSQNSLVTKRETIQSWGIPQNAAVQVLRKLQDCNAGQFKAGRKGHPTRLEWSVSSKSFCESVLELVEGAESSSSTPQSDGNSEKTWEFIEHPFNLRKNLPPLVFKLPSDLTKEEAERLALFMKSCAPIA